MTPKEAKRCCKRFYIYFVMVAATTFWILAFISDGYWIDYYTMDLTILCPIIVALFIADIFFIKTKYLKYACVSYLEDEGDYKHDGVST